MMSAARRIYLLESATRHCIALLEDDYDHEFHYAGRPLLPVASANRAGVVIYFETLFKLLVRSNGWAAGGCARHPLHSALR
jgi:GntR family transcriptional regulator / MocR family aminotransferase